ncbi:MAG TPA: AsmA-like C-terminal region-containing protein [Flavobacterium sp.]|nr:AsmA-like C-terminal region-containing protein [Flavobacterium sp.]
MLKKVHQKVLQKHATFPIWLKLTIRGLGIFAVTVIMSYLVLAWYVNNHKQQVLKSVTEKLNENLNGRLSVGNMETTFLQDFPNLSLHLQNVVIVDSLFLIHKKELLRAGDFDISVNALALLRGTIEIRKIAISNGIVNLFTDENGYSNTSVFRKKTKKSNDVTAGSYPELRKFSLENVKFSIDNQNKNKRYQFAIDKLKGNIDYNSGGWESELKLKTLVNSMAFSTKKGSFMRGKIVEGKFEANYNEDTGLLTVKPNGLEIGGEDFVVVAKFNIAENGTKFEINVSNKAILWKNASKLLSPNISSRLGMFDLEKPISVSCNLIGDFNAAGDPLIYVKAQIRDNQLTTPGGIVTDCNFDGEFTNNHIKGNGLNDKNSAVILSHFTGKYNEIPVVMKKVSILDFEHPMAIGDFESDFELARLENIIDKNLLGFSKGKAKVRLNYKADIVDYKLAKPIVDGLVEIKNADLKYTPRNLAFQDVSVNLDFKNENLFISRIHLKTGKSTVEMDGKILNFLNLYYTAPEKIILDWNIYSPQLHLREFMGFVGSRKKSKIVKTKHGNFTEELNTLFEKSNINMKMVVGKLYYDHFFATNGKANILLSESGITIKSAGLKHADGTIKLNGTIIQSGNTNAYKLNADVANVDISKFFYAFDNFGLQSLKSGNLKGYLSTNAAISGQITDGGLMVPKSMNGNIGFGIKKGELVNFTPLKSIGKLAFAFRDLNNISFDDLNGKFQIAGEKVTIVPMQINSSVLNMDMEGIYSFGKGTKIYIAVPLRNPQKDKNIIDADELAKRRTRGIVLNLIAQDGADGKVKIGLGKKK